MIKLTKYAATLKKEYDEISEVMVNYSYKGFTDEEIGTMEKLLKKMLDNVENAEKSNGNTRSMEGI